MPDVVACLQGSQPDCSMGFHSPVSIAHWQPSKCRVSNISATKRYCNAGSVLPRTYNMQVPHLANASIKCAPVPPQGRQQQDAQDLLHILLESIESEEKKTLAVKQRREQSQSQKPAGKLSQEAGEEPGLCCPPERCWQAVPAASLCRTRRALRTLPFLRVSRKFHEPDRGSTSAMRMLRAAPASASGVNNTASSCKTLLDWTMLLPLQSSPQPTYLLAS